MIDIQTLQDAIDCGILPLDETFLRQQLEMSKRERILKNHPFAIKQQTNGRWQTYYREPDGKKRICIQLATKEKVEDRLVALYKEAENNEKLTLNKLFDEWIRYKETVTESDNTILRHKQQYRKYLQDSDLFQKELKKVDHLSLQSFANKMIKDNKMSSKQWQNVKTILNGMFGYAMDKEMISSNPMDRLKISVKFRQIPRKTGKTETFNTAELNDLTHYLEEKFHETEDIIYLAVELNFLIGLRVGELVALKWDDWTDMTHLHVCREETRNQKKKKYLIVEHTKTHQDRYVPMIPKAISLLSRIREYTCDEKYIFVRESGRVSSRQVSYVLERYAKDTGNPIKRTHKMRKTYASALNANGVPVDAIRECLGHSNLQTTMSYLYNPLTDEETYERIKKAL